MTERKAAWALLGYIELSMDKPFQPAAKGQLVTTPPLAAMEIAMEMEAVFQSVLSNMSTRELMP
jgi:hypothetical protein